MFGFLKKKKDKKKNEKPTKGVVYSPRFGTLEEFLCEYRTGEEHLSLGRINGHAVGITGIVPPADSILVVNNNKTDVKDTLIAPIVEQCKLSYVIYDPDGKYHDALANKMKSKCYDVQVVDLTDEKHGSRIDVFEIANITKNPYWTAVLLSGSIKCSAEEIVVAHNLLMSLMEYDLQVHGQTSIESICTHFVSLYKRENKILENIAHVEKAVLPFEKFNAADETLRDNVYKKLYAHLLKDLANKIRKPNIFAVTSHKKQTITFIKRVPAAYKNLVATFLFNLKTSGLLCENNDASTLIVDTANDEWYNKELLARMCAEINDEMDKSVISLIIRDAVNSEDFAKKQLIVYMHADDANTKDLIFENLKVKALNDEIRKEISEKHCKGKELDERILELSPIDKSVLDKNEDCILIDTTKKIRPIQFNRW